MFNKLEYDRQWLKKNRKRKNESRQRWRLKNRIEKNDHWQREQDYSKVYKKNHTEQTRKTLHDTTQKFKRFIMDSYGGKCVCCGETLLEFLTLDHINGDGRAHRQQIKRNGSGFYRWVAANNFPKDLRVLCYNCNCSRGKLGYCPHEINLDK